MALDDKQKRDLARSRFNSTVGQHWGWITLGRRDGEAARSEICEATVAVVLGGPQDDLRQVIARYTSQSQAGNMMTDCLRVVTWVRSMEGETP